MLPSGAGAAKGGNCGQRGTIDQEGPDTPDPDAATILACFSFLAFFSPENPEELPH
jgi:hypothetical protein